MNNPLIKKYFLLNNKNLFFGGEGGYYYVMGTYHRYIIKIYLFHCQKCLATSLRLIIWQSLTTEAVKMFFWCINWQSITSFKDQPCYCSITEINTGKICITYEHWIVIRIQTNKNEKTILLFCIQILKHNYM